MREDLRAVYGLCASFSDLNAYDSDRAEGFQVISKCWPGISVQAHPLLKWYQVADDAFGHIDYLGVNVMKQMCYLFWLAGMATLVAYGWTDNLLNQVNEVVQFMGQLVAFMIV